MRKEAVNTFGEGLIMDLHPLTTPNNVLTNCLNGTILTYDGNEFVLQNDMGNGEVHTAYLDKGYVPVGMKEHGGIIYVAAHNPITGKSQIGSFPSPQQLYEGEDLNVDAIEFSFGELISMSGNIPYIDLEYYKKKLFEDVITGTPKVFHPGDKFIIVGDVPQDVKKAIADGVIKLRLGVINTSGNIDYLSNDNLKLYDNGLWIYEKSESQEIGDILRSKDLVQVFSAKSSGPLVMVIELKTFETFNLIRKYSCDDNNTITVKFTGETTGTYKGTTKENPDKVGLLEDNTTEVKSEIVKSGTTGTVSYKIMPACPYGVLERLAKNGTIDFDAIRTNTETLNEWRFYVTENYLKIGWGYDYYNLNEGEDISKIVFSFISANRSAELDNASADTLLANYTYEISKEYYNGSFEEMIPLGDATIYKNWIYIVRIERYVGEVKSIIGYKVVYTGGYFNDKYGDTQDFDILAKNKPVIELPIKTDASSKVKEGNITTSLKIDNGAFIEKEVSTPSDYVSEVPDISSSITHKYNTRITGEYEVTVRPNAGFSYDKKMIAGTPSETILGAMFGNSALFDNVDDSEKAYSGSSSLIGDIDTIESELGYITKTTDTNGAVYSGTIKTSRHIIAPSGPVKSTNVDIERLAPIYTPDIENDYKAKLFAFKEVDDVLYCVTGDEDTCCYNSRILRGNAHTDGSYKGPDGGAGADDDGLRACLASMGNGIVGIFGGHDYDHASYKINTGHGYTDGHWFKSKNEIDGEDNFLVATWKDRGGVPYVINIGSQKTSSSDVTSTGIIRLEKMLKCFLSQMLVAQRASKSIYYIGPDSAQFVYHTQFKTRCEMKINLNSGGTTVIINSYLDKDDDATVIQHMNKWVSKTGVKDITPTFKTTIPTSISVPIEYGNNLKIDTSTNILNCYTSAYSYFTTSSAQDLTDAERGKIFIGIKAGVNPDGSLILAKDANGNYSRRSDDTRMYTWYGGNNSTIDLRYNLNARFVNAYSIEGRSGKLPENFFNGIYIQNAHTEIGRWTKKKESHAPDMATNIGFGEKSIFKYW